VNPASFFLAVQKVIFILQYFRIFAENIF